MTPVPNPTTPPPPKLLDRVRQACRVRHYSIRGISVPGRNRWKGKLDLWLTASRYW